MKKILLLCLSLSVLSLPSLRAEEKVETVVEDEAIEEVATLEEIEETAIAAVDNLGPSADGFQSVGDFGPEDEDNVDPRILRDFIESRGLIECRQKCGQLVIAGDVRARWLAAGEKFNGIKQRGSGTTTAINRFKSEFNLFLDYVDPKSWVSTKVRWTTFDGIDGGSSVKPELDRAFIGYDIYEKDCLDFYIELGRSRLDYLFDSRVQFGSVFDGIHLYYTDEWDKIGTFVLHGGPFIVDSFTNHYAWALETYIDEWAGTGFILKYSIIDWNRTASTLNYGNVKDISGKKLLSNNPRYRFLVSQMQVAWVGDVDFARCKTLFLYGAVLTNHDAKRVKQTNFTYANKAWYVGFTLGKLCKACDWSLDMNYQYVQAQAVPEFDLGGIGHGNAANGLLSDAIGSNLNLKTGLFTNFRGWQVSLLYAMTDTLSLRAKAEATRPINYRIGGDFRYKGFEMAAIYAF